MHDEPAFVLHTIPWRETSLIVELLTRDHGRIACVAKGAKRPRSTVRGVLLAFPPLHVGFTGRQEGIAAQAMASVRLPEQDA